VELLLLLLIMNNTETDKQIVIKLLEQFHPFSDLGISGVQARLSEFDRSYLFGIFQEILLTNPHMRKVTTGAMVRIDSQSATPLLLPLLNDPDSDLRYHLCGLLGQYGDSSVVEALVTMLHDSDPNVRLIAAFSLGKVGDENALSALRWTEENDTGTDYEGRPIHLMATEAIRAIIERQGRSL
jgi:HEAT repeat-containing taxis protein